MSTAWLLLRLWLVLQIGLAAGGWLLSAAKMLNLFGYALACVPLAFAAWVTIQNSREARIDFRTDARKLIRRLRKPLPFTVAAIWFISLLGGAIWPTTYVDTLAYRLPRVLHWISEQQWHWIPSDDRRINVVGLNLELVWTPILLLLKTDRLLFLLNLAAFSFLPGIFFSFLREMKVGGRVAWHWMWILPGGYVFAMQAASLGSDAYSAVVALAAVTFALRARRTRSLFDASLSLLAAAFMSGVKQVTIPLGLVWIVAFWPCLRMLVRRPVETAFLVIVAILVSFLPLAFFNWKQTGSWKGFSKQDLQLWEQTSATWGVVGGIFTAIAENLQPPIFPAAESWNLAMHEARTTPIGRHIKYDLSLAFLQRTLAEHTASLGMGICLLWIVTGAAALGRSKRHTETPRNWNVIALRWLPFLAASVFLAKSAVAFNGRYLAPYYPFFFPLALAPDYLRGLTRKQWWRGLAIATNLVTIALLLLSRQRPVLGGILGVTRSIAPNSPQLERARDKLMILQKARREVFAELEQSIPVSEKSVGYAIGRQPYLEWPLWKPYGRRKVYRICADQTAADLRGLGIRFVVIDPSTFLTYDGIEPVFADVDAWVTKYHARLVKEFDAGLEAGLDWPARIVELID